MKLDAKVADRIASPILLRLSQVPGPLRAVSAAWDGIDLIDLVHDLMLAREQRDRFQRDLERIKNAMVNLEGHP